MRSARVLPHVLGDRSAYQERRPAQPLSQSPTHRHPCPSHPFHCHDHTQKSSSSPCSLGSERSGVSRSGELHLHTSSLNLFMNLVQFKFVCRGFSRRLLTNETLAFNILHNLVKLLTRTSRRSANFLHFFFNKKGRRDLSPDLTNNILAWPKRSQDLKHRIPIELTLRWSNGCGAYHVAAASKHVSALW